MQNQVKLLHGHLPTADLECARRAGHGVSDEGWGELNSYILCICIIRMNIRYTVEGETITPKYLHLVLNCFSISVILVLFW